MKVSRPIEVAPEPRSVPARAVRLICAIAVVATPLLISPRGQDSFRAPKDLAFIAFALLLLPALALLPVRRLFREYRNEWILACAVLAWIWIRALTTPSRPIGPAAMATLTVLLAAGFAVAARSRDLKPLYWLLPAAIVNAVLTTLQRLKLYSPFELNDPYGTDPVTGLLGTSNDVCMTLLFAALAGVTLLRVERQRRWWIFAAVSEVIIVAGLLMSGSVAAVVAFAAGIWAFVMMMLPSYRRRVLWTMVVISVVVTIGTVTPVFRRRISQVYDAAMRGNYNEVVSNRIVPFLAAWEMFADAPLTGMGPNGFRARYFEYKLRVDTKYRWLLPEEMAEWSLGRVINFGQTHNEFLQIASELGLPGVLLFVTGIVLVGMRSFKPVPPDAAGRAAHLMAFPFATATALLCMAQFPFRLAAPLISLILMCVLSIVWSREAEAE